MSGRVKVEELGDRRFLSMEVRKDDFLPLQRKLLELETDIGFLETHFFSVEDGERMLIDFTEFQALGEYLWEKKEVSQVLSMLIKLCEELRKADNFLFFSDQIPLSLKTIYVNERTSKVRFAYLPGFAREGTLQDHFLSLLSEIAAFGISEEWEACGTLLERRVREQNPGAKGLIRLLSQLQREYCQKEKVQPEWVEEPIALEMEAGAEPAKSRLRFHFKDWLQGLTAFPR